eukprot:TRINITY_DN1204_c1_g1_i7.p1 TRINITY_DN1204_c1_g1~~TRINITY_DN1204_c1_g1_i7.p1  ORF type:complete len:478 (+),score=187.01 TRINITY_DN1204_c1_g1_i7:55-1488(+)
MLRSCVAVLSVAMLMGTAVEAQDTNHVGGYLLVKSTDQLKVLAANAKTLPITRLWISFVSPTLTYVNGSNTLVGTGLNLTSDADGGFAQVKQYVQQIEAGGVETFISMGGWNYNCYPYLYMAYSVGGYGTSTPNYWKIQQYGGGSVNGCTTSNQYCWVCEPASEHTSLDKSFSIFPEPAHSASWTAAKKYVQAGAGNGPAPQWNEDMIPGTQWKAPSGVSSLVPGSTQYIKMNRNPYEDIVYLAKDLGCTGVDVDYEEMWHADTFKTGNGPWDLTQTVYKYAAILKNVESTIKTVAPAMKLSTAAGAVGAWSGNWWGGNLKGVWLKVNQMYPDLMQFMATGANSGGVNVMTYDLSSNEQYHECPEDGVCALDQQVAFYMNTYDQANIAASVGYEIGTPAYPDPTHDPTHQLPLTNQMMASIISQTQPKHKMGFFWELYKPAQAGQATPTQLAQALCNALLPGNSRCTGVIPPYSDEQ